MINFKRDNFPLRVISTNMQQNVPIHSHDFIELVFFVRGNASHSIFAKDQKNDYSVMQGDCFAILPGESHAFENGNQAFYYNIIFSPLLISNVTKELKEFDTWMDILGNQDITVRNKVHLNLNQRMMINDYIQRLISELTNRHKGYKLCAKTILIEILLLILRSVPLKMVESQTSSRINPNILNIIGQIEKDPVANYTLSNLAKKAHMCNSGFSKKFKEIAGSSPMDFIISLRIEKAEKLLLSTNLSIYDIAEKCGFYNECESRKKGLFHTIHKVEDGEQYLYCYSSTK
jgi:AraC-like DNA-binding protein